MLFSDKWNEGESPVKVRKTPNFHGLSPASRPPPLRRAHYGNNNYRSNHGFPDDSPSAQLESAARIQRDRALSQHFGSGAGNGGAAADRQREGIRARARPRSRANGTPFWK
ncbi:hypothetical protein BCEN4_2130002 [Burkholderia cenocepacia]|nr:hypothetical protein BCEN4_2130002 [Burkholderia cenocepacia]